MKKFVLGVLSMILVLSVSMVCYAGDVPESLLSSDTAQVYFGEVRAVDNGITVVAVQNIKGEFEAGAKLSYPEFVSHGNVELKAGETYLCGYLDENNPLDVWEVTSLDTTQLEITAQDDMSQRMQKYLNEGEFENAQNKLLATMEKGKETGDVPSETGVNTVSELIQETEKNVEMDMSKKSFDDWMATIAVCVAAFVVLELINVKRSKSKNSKTNYKITAWANKKTNQKISGKGNKHIGAKK